MNRKHFIGLLAVVVLAYPVSILLISVQKEHDARMDAYQQAYETADTIRYRLWCESHPQHKLTLAEWKLLKRMGGLPE